MQLTNKEIIRNMYDALGKGDLDTILSYLDDDVVVEEAESMPYGGLWRGKDSYRELITKVGSTWENVNFDVQVMVADGDYVIALSELTATGIKTQKPFATSLAEVFRMEGGKVKHVKPYYFDTKLISEID